MVLGGDGVGSNALDKILSAPHRLTVGGYFDGRITSPHQVIGTESSYVVSAKKYNSNLPSNLWLIVGDPSLEIQAQVISQIGGQTLPQNAWRNVHNWLLDLISGVTTKLGQSSTRVFIDCNPSFSAYTELAMMAAERVIVPCSSDGSSARAIDNVGELLFGIGSPQYRDVSFKAKAESFNMALPLIHSVLLNRSTSYNQKASKAFNAMFDEIKRRTENLRRQEPSRFIAGELKFHVVPDSHSVAIVCSHLGKPLYDVFPGKYSVHDTEPQVNSEPLDRYKVAVAELLASVV